MNTQPDPLRVAEELDCHNARLDRQAAKVIRTQHADIERKDALLRQALEVFSGYVLRTGLRHEVIDTITSELSK